MLESETEMLTVSLPTIVVAGNQSSGKSSLIEAISGVSFAVSANESHMGPS